MNIIAEKIATAGICPEYFGHLVIEVFLSPLQLLKKLLTVLGTYGQIFTLTPLFPHLILLTYSLESTGYN